MKRDEGTPVIFRVLKSGQVIALLPEMDVLGGCASVKEVVKKSMVSGLDNYKSVVEHSRPARESETTELVKFFKGAGVVVNVRKKWNKREKKS
jgi:hypothetical protein